MFDASYEILLVYGPNFQIDSLTLIIFIDFKNVLVHGLSRPPTYVDRSVTNGGYSLHRTWRTPQNLGITSFSKKRCKGQNLGITWRTPTWGSPQTWGSILKLGITTFPQKRCNGLNLGITFKTWGSPPLGFQSRASNFPIIEGLSGAISAQG